MAKVEKLKKTATPLVLLRQIRDVMAQETGAQARLDKVVSLLAESFASEVCSVYLLRAGDILELFASQGLNKTSVHLTRLSVGQGIVGDVAASSEPVNLAHANVHPKYEYRPETGEEIYNAFAAVPILQGGRAIGVVVVQREEAKRYTQAQIEVLQTIAMVLSELAMSGQLVNRTEIKSTADGLFSQQLAGVMLSSGMVKAPAVLHQPELTITHYVATDSAHEKERLETSLRALQEAFDAYINSADSAANDDQREIMEMYLLYTQDRGWLSRMDEALESGLTAEAAVKKVQEELSVKMSQIASPYIKERIQDLEDLSNHLLKHLMGKTNAINPADLPESFVLVARTLGPAELLDYDHKRIKGLIIEESSATSHTAVIARAMDIPALAKVEDATSIIHQGDMVIINAEQGTVYVRPNHVIEQEMDNHIRQFAELAAQYEALHDVEAVTKDGVRISLNINAGLFVDSNAISHAGVDGIGLYRTELPYMTAEDFPDVEKQQKHYAAIYKQLPDKKVVFRSFDIGGDKKVPYLQAGEEENPAMGWRATRIGLDRPGILRTQFRALIAAAGGRPLHLMFPFIAQANEFDAAKELFDYEMSWAKEQGYATPTECKIGIMIEIPSILWQLDSLMPKLDFISIGSNDLMQFLFACDRGAAHMSYHYDTLSPVMLRVVDQVIRQAAMHKTEVGFCGEMARKPLDALALMGIGVRNLSVSASAIGPLKAMIRSVDLAALTDYVQYLKQSSHPTIRHWLSAYAIDHHIAI
ncbi:MAG: phosphoenolpyruvate--protein phosphotransferase [Rickettsiales bacterium]|nr:phosphoenolpyruvate--protein phosphotransferase [Rickettsiales bacterium]